MKKIAGKQACKRQGFEKRGGILCGQFAVCELSMVSCLIISPPSALGIATGGCGYLFLCYACSKNAILFFCEKRFE